MVCVLDFEATKTQIFLLLWRDIWVESEDAKRDIGEGLWVLGRYPFWSKGAVVSPPSHFWHILSYYFALIWPCGVEGLILLVSLFWTGDGDVAGRGPSIHSCLVHSLYTSRVALHPHCPGYCQMSISEQHCAWINFVCTSMRARPPVVSIMAGGTAVESVWRQAASERHPSRTLPSWSLHEYMHRGKCIHIYHQLWKVPTVNNLYSRLSTLHTHTHRTFFQNPYLLLWRSCQFVTKSV